MIREIRGHPVLATSVVLEVPSELRIALGENNTLLLTFHASDDYIEAAGAEMEMYFKACKSVKSRLRGGGV